MVHRRLCPSLYKFFAYFCGMQEAYIVAGYRTAVGKAPRGKLRHTCPDDMAVAVIERIKADFPKSTLQMI